MRARSLLLVVAHPDDEVLGAGGLAGRAADHGIPVRACIVSGSAEARAGRPPVEVLHAQTAKAQEMLGAGDAILGTFPNLRLNTVDHVELVRFVEEAITATGADVLVTHHPGDLNQDHAEVSRACAAAARLHQRGGDAPPLSGLYYMEVPSSTDWSFPGSRPFLADAFVELGDDDLDRKLAALGVYDDVMREPPHPRSEAVVRALATQRGAQAGVRYAEAFETAFHRLDAW